MRHALLSALFILAPAALADPQYRLLHRLYYPSQEEPSNFFERGTLDLSVRSTPALLPAPTAADDLHARLKPAHEFSDALYQIALAPLSSEDLFDISSVKACHLTAGAQESIILRYTSDAPSATPYAVDLFVSPIPRDGACPSNPTSLAAPQNTTLTVSLPRHPPLPELRAPPQMSQTGEPVKPPEEQTFLQKYWLYMVIFLGMMMFAGGAAEDGQGGQGGGSGGQ